MIIRLTFLIVSLGLWGCATPADDREFQREFAGNPNPIVYDNFMVSRPMPNRPQQNSNFYYKHCDNVDHRPGWAKEGTECSATPF